MSNLEKPYLIDSHSHIQFSDFDKDREQVIGRMIEKNIRAINIGNNLEMSRQAVELANKHSCFFVSVGVHPNDAGEEEFKEEEYISLLEIKKLSQ